jgi:hypothetical protein
MRIDPIHHVAFHSTDCFDPNGLRVEERDFKPPE